MDRKVIESLSIISNTLNRYKNVAVASSFGKDSVVLLHLCQRIDPNVKVFSIMTPFKFQETRIYKQMLSMEWELNLFTFEEPENLEYSHRDPEKCCDYYKVKPAKYAIEQLKLDAWISGLRGTEGHTRKFLEVEEEKNGLIKINPILHWTEADIWLYHAVHKIPVHPLYTRGYRSLGCEPCSKPYTDTERGGRWAGTDKCGGECGIHTKPLR